MPIDIRAEVTCSLGTLISATISDDYIQGVGIIKTKGNCEISDLITPEIGSIVRFTYKKRGIIRSVPRVMRVLSYFADPFRRTTKVELGCTLTYKQEYRSRINFGTPEELNANVPGLTDEDAKIIINPIDAQLLIIEICNKLGIAQTGKRLKNFFFSVEQFEFKSPYVQTMSDLLVSGSLCGYINGKGVLEIFALDGGSNGGPVLTVDDIIDVSPIGIGTMPAGVVYVRYSTLKLKVPDNTEVVCRFADEPVEEESTWGNDVSSTKSKASATFSYRLDGEGDLQTRTYNWIERSQETTIYKTIKAKDPSAPDNPPQRKNVILSRNVRIYSSAAGVAGGYAQQRLANGLGFNTFEVYKDSKETFSYNNFGYETRRELVTTGSLLYLYGTAGIDFVYDAEDGSKEAVQIGQRTGVLEKIVVSTLRNGDLVKTVTERYGPWAESIAGQQAIANARESITTAAEAEEFLERAYGSLTLLDVSIDISRGGSRQSREVPSPGEALVESLAEDSGDPNNGFRTESVSELQQTGGTGGPIIIEMSMPYAPDDRFERITVSTDPLRYCYYARSSDAVLLASRFGRTQNRLNLGGRFGINIQTVPEKLPSAPFSSFIVNAGKFHGSYRTNGMTWTMDSSGIVVSVDALFWGTAGTS